MQALDETLGRRPCRLLINVKIENKKYIWGLEGKGRKQNRKLCEVTSFRISKICMRYTNRLLRLIHPFSMSQPSVPPIEQPVLYICDSGTRQTDCRQGQHDCPRCPVLGCVVSLKDLPSYDSRRIGAHHEDSHRYGPLASRTSIEGHPGPVNWILSKKLKLCFLNSKVVKAWHNTYAS